MAIDEVDFADSEVINFSMIANMDISDMLEDSLSNMVDALQMWSRPQVESNAASISGWLEKLLECLSFYDEVLSTFLQA